MLSKTELTQRCRDLQLLLLDVDGVLSDGRLYYNDQGQELKSFNTLDGHGIKMLQSSGVKVGIITGRKSHIVSQRAANLGIDLLIQGREDKFLAMQELLQDFRCDAEHIAFMGDDWPDLLVMTKVALALSVPNAHPEVKARAHWVSSCNGGQGAVREACDMIMKAQNTYLSALEPYI